MTTEQLRDKAGRIVAAYDQMQAMFPLLASGGDVLSDSVEICRHVLADLDETPLDEAYLRSIGFDERDGWNGIWLDGVRYLPSILGDWLWYETYLKSKPQTRGQLRRLLSALGVEVRG